MTDSKNLVAPTHPKRHTFSSNRRKVDKPQNPKEKMELDTCSERRRAMTAWWRWSGKLKGREGWDDLKPDGEERRKKNTGEKNGPAWPTSAVQCKKRLVDERKLQLYTPHGAESTN